MNLHHRCQNSVPYCHGTPPTKPASKSAAKAGMLRFFSRVYFSLPFDPFLVHLSCVYSCFCPHPPPSPLTTSLCTLLIPHSHPYPLMTSLCTLLIPHSHPSFPHPYYLPPPPPPLSPPSFLSSYLLYSGTSKVLGISVLSIVQRLSLLQR